MINVNDLHIEDEILPIFDFTFNIHSGRAVRDLLEKPLPTPESILNRQQVLKGFDANHEILKDYSFSRFNLSEIHDFFETFFAGDLSAGKLRWKLTFSDKERSQKKGRLILLVRIFHRIYTTYTSKINTSVFPSNYAKEVDGLNDFFKAFNLDHYEMVFRKNKFGVSHMVELIKIISEKVTNGQAAIFWNRWFLFEAYLSVSTAIHKHGFVFPSFGEQFLVKEFYHPLLKSPVKNDIAAEKNVILLTGPNMSGKSTLLKAISLCVYLGHIGFAVPASIAIMPFFNTISVAINLTDSIVSGYSHFMSEIITLKNVLTEVKEDSCCFAVFDELFRGTNIEDALEISSATIKGLSNFPGSIFFISTHLHQLKEIKEVQSGKVATWFIDCKLSDNDIPSFTYKLKEGWSDLKLGRILFEKEGLNKMLE